MMEAGDIMRHRLVAVSDVAPGYVKAFDVGGQSVLLVCSEQGVRAMQNICPHAGSPLEGGRISGHRFRCPRHGYIFDLETGVSSRGPREGFGPLRFCDLAEEDGYYVAILDPEGDNGALSG